MKATVLALPVLGLVFGFAGPAGAWQSDRLSVTEATVVSQQSTCKEGEEWNEDTKKCVKKEG